MAQLWCLTRHIEPTCTIKLWKRLCIRKRKQIAIGKKVFNIMPNLHNRWSALSLLLILLLLVVAASPKNLSNWWVIKDISKHCCLFRERHEAKIRRCPFIKAMKQRHGIYMHENWGLSSLLNWAFMYLSNEENHIKEILCVFSWAKIRAKGHSLQ